MANGNKVGWVWDHTGQSVLPDLGTDRFWPWLNSQPQSQSENQCLSVFRPEGRNEMFADEDCGKILSFVCEESEVNDLPAVETVYFHNRSYTFHALLSTWEEAEEACRSNGSYLVVLNTEEEAEFISQNPFGFHDIWVGSKWNPKIDRWEWVHSGEVIKMENKSDAFSFSFVNNKRPDHDCLNVYRDSFQKHVYLDRKCNEKHSFVCEEGGRIDITFTKTYKIENRRYQVYSKAATWEEASNTCLSRGQYLATIYSLRILDFIARNVSKEFHDLWVDGHYDGRHWKWVRKGKVIPSMLKRNTNAKSQLWVHSPTRPGHNCLNLYHPTSNRILFLDRKCNETFGFICESISPSISKIETRILKGRQYTFYSLKVNWNKANNICKSSGSYLAVVKTPDEAALITEFGEEFLDLWVGARVTDSSRIWEHTKESVTNATDVYPYLPAQLTPHMDCVVIGRGQAGSAYLNDTLCNSNHNFVCEEQGDNGDTYVETYTFNNQQYILSTRKTSWSRAEWLCHLSGSHLAILNTKEEAEFFNNVSRKFHDLWIGGKQQDGKWIWNYTNEYIISEDSSADTYEPQFVNSSVKAKKDMCLNWYRESNRESYLIGRSCEEEYGFICEGISKNPDIQKCFLIFFSTFSNLPSHCGILGNENADALAKKGSTATYRPVTNSTYYSVKRFVESTYLGFNKQNLITQSQGKKWISLHHNPQLIPDLPRKSSVAAFRLATGHDCLAKHLHRIGIYQVPNCPLCNSNQEMDSEHLKI
ncbi:hypothetical protein ANN_20914 [Periplaneta americana]|uniref:C-type lectin domain-containing protein n=1 Tax=Periplaneta americana TaxID=6978 RepID=A0ABQ8SDX9_PERAM|nr:hypothetical protein ANN_20914 [Periplaneta americana]